MPSSTSTDFCSSSSSPSFQPIRSQIPIPTAHVMPSTAGASASKSRSFGQEDALSSTEGHRSSSGSRTPSGSTSKSSSLSKSASSPNLDAQPAVGADHVGPKPDCLSRYRSLINGLDHSLFPTDHTRLDEGQRFETPAVEPTLNQSALLGGLCPDVRLRLQTTGIRELPDFVSEAYRGGMEQSYKVLPEARPSLAGIAETSNQRGSQPGTAGSAGAFSNPLSLQTQALLREHTSPKSYDPLRQDRCSELSSWQQKQQLETLRLQVEQMQYPSLYSAPLHSESGKWDALVKASESLLKEKELIIERQIRSRDKHINNLKKKCQKEAELKRENQQRIETLERYLADLPTLEDYQSQNKQALEEQISQEESSSQALREEALAKDQNVLELHTAMKELSAQNQELIEQNLTLQEQMSDPEQMISNQASSGLQPAGAHLTQRLHSEIASCLSDLRSLCSILTQRARGQDPNLSLLLGLTCKLSLNYALNF
ncbi:hypothetical protein GOODEAATRI_012626 [Goodea atripinnis]|uniref:Centrosomal protein of 85 kDa-like CC4 coiled-coil domain-containing protein n=1 Tax=Goodea atripinnis TaxID=208336 RepID=A0ABV0P5D4_9TELE